MEEMGQKGKDASRDGFTCFADARTMTMSSKDQTLDAHLHLRFLLSIHVATRYHAISSLIASSRKSARYPERRHVISKPVSLDGEEVVRPEHTLPTHIFASTTTTTAAAAAATTNAIDTQNVLR